MSSMGRGLCCLDAVDEAECVVYIVNPEQCWASRIRFTSSSSVALLFLTPQLRLFDSADQLRPAGIVSKGEVQ